jgi:lysophospholipase
VIKMILLTLVCFTFNAFAISELNYKSEYAKKIIPVINAYKASFFIGQKNIPIHYARFTTNFLATRCLVVLPGRTEAIEKYAEVLYDLDNGVLAGEFQYFLMDHRGQGSSGRMLEDSQKGHVDSFNNYVLDLKTFMDKVVKAHNCSETSLLAHSLGAGISAKFLQKYPEYFDRAALTSPMLKILTAPYSYEVARTLVVASILAGQGKKYGPGQKAFDPTRNFEANAFTTSPVRYEMAMDIFDIFPVIRLGGVTNQWLNEVMYATAGIRAHYNDIKIPLKVIYAGIESYSDKNEMIRLCDKAPHCTRTYLETSKHEVLMDRDDNRDVVIRELEDFLIAR